MKSIEMKAAVLLIALLGVWVAAAMPVDKETSIGGPVEEFLCDLCYWFFGEIEKLVENGRTEAELITYLHEVSTNTKACTHIYPFLLFPPRLRNPSSGVNEIWDGLLIFRN